MDDERRQQERQEIEDILLAVSSMTYHVSSSEEDSDFETTEHPKCDNFVQTIEKFGDVDFKSHMRLQRQTVEYLISRYSQSEFSVEASGGGRTRIGCRKSIYIYIWYISNTVTYRQLGNLFGVSKSSAWIAVNRVTSWIISIGPEYVKWPEGTFADDVQKKFQDKKGIPGVIGAIDCTHISIKAPTVDKECYFDRKQNYSLVLQAVVDANKRFIDITCGEPGSLHDSRVLRRSDLYLRVQTEYQTLFPNESFILGDSAYPVKSWLVPPFKDAGNLSDAQKRFNFKHSSTRMVVENAFGLLKGRFRRLLKFTEQTNLTAISKIIVSACVLHNICITHDDLPMEIEEGMEEVVIVPADSGADNTITNSEDSNRREVLFNYLLQENII